MSKKERIKFLDLNRQYRLIKKDVDNAIKRVLEDSHFIGGEELEGFEKAVARYCKSKYALGLNSGTDALYLALRALDIKEGDEVITTPFTFFATAETIANTGAKPVFADIESDGFNVGSQEIVKKITKKTKAIIPVHLFGEMADMDKIIKIAKKYRIKIIEDAAQSFGARSRIANGKWQMAGAIGDIGCFSFFPSKTIGAFGDGGMVVSNNKLLIDKIALLRSHGSSKNEKYINLILGMNSRLDAIQAAILRVKLKYVEEWNNKRRKLAKYYSNKLGSIDGLVVPETQGKDKVFHQYTVRSDKRDELKTYLSRYNIPTMIYYPMPLHLQPAFKYLGYKKGDFPEAERASREVLSLPIYPEITSKEQDFIMDKIQEFYVRR